MSVVDHSQLHGVRMDILVDDQHFFRKVCGGRFPVGPLWHALHKEQRQANLLSGQSLQQILGSVFLGLSSPLITPPSAGNMLPVQQKLAVLKYFASSFMKWSVRKQLISARTSHWTELRGGIWPDLNDTIIAAPDRLLWWYKSYKCIFIPSGLALELSTLPWDRFASSR